MYKLKLTSRAKKDLKNVKKLYRQALGIAFEELKEDPSIGKPLIRNLNNQYSLKVSVYRILYKINNEDKTVTILTAGHRGTVYE